MSILHQKRSPKIFSLEETEKPQLFREVFPYTSISRTDFDDVLMVPRPAEPMFITDTTFRDGQQARPPIPSNRSPACSTCCTNSAAKAV